MDWLLRPEILIALMLVAVLARIRTTVRTPVSGERDDAGSLERRARRSGLARPGRYQRTPSYR
jgi:hypothetical protein